jgi:hypothetical protein
MKNEKHDFQPDFYHSLKFIVGLKRTNILLLCCIQGGGIGLFPSKVDIKCDVYNRVDDLAYSWK